MAAVGDTFRRFDATFAPLTPPAAMADLHQPLCAAISELGKSCNFFMTKPSPEWTLAFLHSRRDFCRGLVSALRAARPAPDDRRAFPARPAHRRRCPPHPAAPPTGFIQHKRNDERSDYTLYIPEDYSPDKPLPLIVALHGGYGQGSEYVWTWLRPARSRGYAILAPKSFGEYLGHDGAEPRYAIGRADVRRSDA